MNFKNMLVICLLVSGNVVYGALKSVCVAVLLATAGANNLALSSPNSDSVIAIQPCYQYGATVDSATQLGFSHTKYYKTPCLCADDSNHADAKFVKGALTALTPSPEKLKNVTRQTRKQEVACEYNNGWKTCAYRCLHSLQGMTWDMMVLLSS